MIKIDAKNVDFYYGDFHALKNISMEIERIRPPLSSDRPVAESLLSSACSTA